jgi:pilus assembly protein CpaF
MTPTWLSALLDDPTITDLCLNGPREVFVDQGQGMRAASPPNADLWSESEMRSWTLDQISRAGKTWDAKYPFIDAVTDSGHRMHVAFPPLARQGILVSLRRLPVAHARLTDRWRSSPLYEPLKNAVVRGDSILISGATGAGKTTLATDLLNEVSHHERILALEDTPELSPAHPHFVSLTSRPPNADGFGEVSVRTLLKQALRMRPDRIVLGECRGAEVLDLLQALNTGHRGSLATLHANSAREALRRIELLCLIAAGNAIPVAVIRELLAAGVQWVAQVKKIGPQRMITELWKIEGREGETILMRPLAAAAPISLAN